MSKPNDPIIRLLDDKDAMHVLKVFTQAGFESRFIGGCVRDTLLERPVKDIDIAVTCTPDATIELLQKTNIYAIPTGIKHGTVTAVYHDRHFEITTLRDDVETDGRHATVAFSTDWKTDAERRDFTINALSVDEQGVLHDYTNGLNDLDQKNLRFIGDAAQRIQEDYLRILRYFRFASQLNWKIANDGQAKICSAFAPKLQDLSRERIQAELMKLVYGEGCIHAVLTAEKHGIFAGLIGNSVDFDTFGNLVHLEHKHNEPDALRRVIALVRLHNDRQLDRVTMLSNKEKKRIEDIKQVAIYVENNRPLIRQLYDHGVQAVKDFYYLQNDDRLFRAINEWVKPSFPVTAADVLPFTNGEGPMVGIVLKGLENYWIDHSFTPSKNDLMAMVHDFNQ